MTDKTELEVTAADDGKEYVIRKGEYFYRPKAEGYTSNANDAGRFSLKQAILHSFPNGPDGPRDGITYELATRTPDPTPVAWMYKRDGIVHVVRERVPDLPAFSAEGWTETPLYAHPPAVPDNGLVEALERIAAPAIVSLDQCPDADQPNGWRHLAVDRIDIARTALAAYRGEA